MPKLPKGPTPLQTPGVPARPGMGWKEAGSAVLLLALVAAAYHSVLGAGFIWDDDAHVIGPGMATLRGLGRIWTRPGATQQYYPVLYSAMWLERAAWGAAPAAYHSANIVLHASASWLLYRLLRRLEAPGALFGAALFAVHPVGAETVAWISEEKNTLSAVFGLASALAYLKFDRGRKRGVYAVGLVLFVLAILTKSVTATIPAALLVMLWWKKGSLSWQRDALPLLPWLCLGAVAGIWTSWMEVSHVGAVGAPFALGPAARVIVAGRALWFYLGKDLWPANLVFVYPRWTLDAGSPLQYAGAAAAAAVLAAFWALRGRTRAPLAAALLFAGTLFPALGFLNVFPFLYSFVADHFQYLASAVIFASAAGALALAAARLPKAAQIAGAAGVLGALCMLTSRACAKYQDNEALWADTLGANPAAWMADNNMAADLLARGRTQEAMVYAVKAVELNPDNAQAHLTLGDVLLVGRRQRDAFAEYSRALEIEPNSPIAHNNVANAYLQQGKLEDAVRHYQAAIRAKPDYAKAYANLAVVYLRSRRVDDAASALEKALDLDPADAGAEANLGVAYIQKGRLDDAISHFRRAAELDPGFAAAQTNLGNALLQAGRAADALGAYEKAAALMPGSAQAHIALGYCLMRVGRPSDAALEFRRALEIEPSNERARASLQAAESGR